MNTRRRLNQSILPLFGCLAILVLVVVGCQMGQRSNGLAAGTQYRNAYDHKSARDNDPQAESREARRAQVAPKESESRLARREAEDDEDAECTDGEAAIEFRRKQRLDGNGQIEHGALLRAKQQVDDALQTRDAGIWSWEWLGPGNVGGRVRGICFATSTTMYLGGVCGGIWKSIDTGNTWAPLTDFLASMSVTSIVVDPTNSNRLYAATGEAAGSSQGIPGAGVFRTTTGGTIWTQLPQTAGWNDTMRLETVPGTQTLFAATDIGIFRSTDGGDNWTQVLVASGTMDVDVDPNNTSRVLVGTASDVYLSTSGGGAGSFVLQTSGALNKLPANGATCEVTFGASGYMWVAMDRNQGDLFRSTDGGVTWTLRNTGTAWLSTQGNYGNALWASPDDNTLVVVGGIDSWRSIDGGTTLTKISDWHFYNNNGPSAHADFHNIVAPPGYGANNRRLYFGNDGGIQSCSNVYSVAQQSGWTNLASNLGITQFYHGAASATGSYILGGAQDNSTARFRPADGTDGWWVPFTGDGGCCAINPSNTAIQYAEWQYLNFMKSTNGGQTFSGATTNLTESGSRFTAPFIAPFDIDPFNSSALVAGALSVWRTTDSAGTWSVIRNPVSNSPFVSVVAFAPSLQNRIWVGYADGRVSRTTTNVGTWTDVDAQIPNRFVTDIAVNPNNSSEVFVTIGGYLTDTVWYTTDNGVNWTQRTGSGSTALPAVQVNTITYHPQNNNWVYVGTDIGVFASEDKGLTWSQTPRYSGVGTEGPTGAEVDDLFWQGSDFLIAATHGRGMWRVRPLVTVYVNKANNTGNEDGTAPHPFNTVQEGISAAGYGATISIQTGDYNETLTTTFSKRGTVVATNGLVRIH